MRAAVLFLALLAFPAGAWAVTEDLQPLKFENVIDGATIIASGRMVALWGVKPPEPSAAASYTARQYLATMLGHGDLRCGDKFVSAGRRVMKCYIDDADVSSLIVQMGMGRAADPYYLGEEATARAKHRGIWKPSN